MEERYWHTFGQSDEIFVLTSLIHLDAIEVWKDYSFIFDATSLAQKTVVPSICRSVHTLWNLFQLIFSHFLSKTLRQNTKNYTREMAWWRCHCLNMSGFRCKFWFPFSATMSSLECKSMELTYFILHHRLVSNCTINYNACYARWRWVTKEYRRTILNDCLATFILLISWLYEKVMTTESLRFHRALLLNGLKTSKHKFF